ncbi:MAG: DUF4382 domain-containing protein [Myxococcota bacterium]|nr:DUF4382 domain-containing protein [Myxococcota bacterium]
MNTSVLQFTSRPLQDRRPGPGAKVLLCAAFLLLFSAPFLACSGTDQTGTGNVGLLMTDAPSDDFEAVNLTVDRIELIRHGEAGSVVFEGRETFDLLALRDASELFSFTGAVPVGRYHKIRMTLADRGIELVDDRGQREHPELPPGNRIDFEPSVSLDVDRDTMLIVEVDIDVDRSIHIDASRGDRYRFRPIVHTQIVKNILHGKMARLRGTIVSVDEESQKFRLCQMRRPPAFISMAEGHGRSPELPAADAPLPEREERHHPRRRCIGVTLAPFASLFDENGDPLESVTEEDQGSQAMVAGRIHPRGLDMQMTSHLILFGPPGTFQHLRGIVATDYDEATEQFTLDLRGDRPDLIVQLQEGTKIFEYGGVEVGADAITEGRYASAMGLRTEDEEGNSGFKAVVIGLKLEEPDMEPLKGEITSILLDPDPELDECHIEFVLDQGGEEGIRVSPETRILLIDPDSQTSSLARLEDLQPGDRADIYGPPPLDDQPCVKARAVIAFSNEIIPEAEEGESQGES